MSRHSITDKTQLFVNGEAVEKLGKKARTRDVGLTIGKAVDGDVRSEQIAEMRAQAERRASVAAKKLAAKKSRR